MNFNKQNLGSRAIKITVEENGQVLGRAYLYLIKNDLHDKPYGLLEDVFVEEKARGRGLGTALVKAVIEEANAQGCYKLVGTSRYARESVHKMYLSLGFSDYGKEFKMTF
ncbi:MAG: GNAT family N-acetyltransferase [Patescibacteria group bacterium]